MSNSGEIERDADFAFGFVKPPLLKRLRWKVLKYRNIFLGWFGWKPKSWWILTKNPRTGSLTKLTWDRKSGSYQEHSDA